MSNRRYELTFILPPALSEEDITAKQELVVSWITNQNGEVLKANHWGRRRLAYSIDNYKEGYYIFLEFQSEPGAIKDVERRLGLDGGVLRHLVVRSEE